MKLLAFSDVHQDTAAVADLVARSGDVDVVIGAGDFASVHEGLEPTIAALRPIEKPVVLVPGNNETEAALRTACEDFDNATVLHGESIELGGVEFFGLGGGIPVTPWDWSFDLTEDEAGEALAACPDDAVLILHSPPLGHVDAGLGSRAVLDWIECRCPPLVLCGHIHQCWGQESWAACDCTRVLNLGPAGRIVEI